MGELNPSRQTWRAWWSLRHIPGPPLASITSLERMRWVLSGKVHLIHQRLHDKYGQLVRIAPNMVIFSNPEAIPAVYPSKPGFLKGDFYVAARPYTRGRGQQHLVFNTIDEERLKVLKRPIAPLYANVNAAAYEPLVNEVLCSFDKQIRQKLVGSPSGFDLGKWLQFYAFDSVGTMTFSRAYGFIQAGRDIDGMLAAIHDFVRASAPMTQVPWLDLILRKNLVGDAFQRLLGHRASDKLIGFCSKAFQDRKAGVTEADKMALKDANGAEDFLSHFLKLQEADPKIPSWAPISWTFSNVVAGSDSTGSIMRTTMFNLLTNPHTLDKLYQELRVSSGQDVFPAYKDIRNLPYLDACILEGARLHPPFALPFERVVPKGGVAILGQYLPEGTLVGGSPYVVNRDRETFGQDAETWRPERWIENGEQHKKKLKQALLTFGAGRRVCLGQHVGILNTKKMLSYLVINYEMRIVDPRQYRTECFWFFMSHGLVVSLKERPSC
ncbi:cytochrome P450 CYP4/CYP19/CYP26 subfamily protein [Colletotrichum somersetense]|nr:cytochrome P450 CYP4/CYP19/CYP26 subfamily protein [Colletotrichum somersetense]